MGRDKAMLPFGSESMLARVVRLVSEVVSPERIVIVAAPGQVLPAIEGDVLIARDAVEYRGPLSGLAMGMHALNDRADAIYATACDVPLLVPAIITKMFGLLGEHDAAIPVEGQYVHPLAAVYRISKVLPHVERLLAANRLQANLLFHETNSRAVPIEELRDIDPQLNSFKNLNSDQDYLAALHDLGIS
jgi:molybdopterin-guanine dinucleotide biosynthesis protein A